MKQFLAFALLGTLLSGCATLSGLREPPRVRLVSITPTDVQLFEQRFRVTLEVRNPNSEDITIRGLDYAIEVNGKIFAEGVRGKPFTIPAHGEKTADVEVVSTLQRVLEQLQALTERDEPTLDYAISGHVDVDGIPFPLPFEHQDTLTLPGFENREKKDRGVQPAKPKAIAI